MISPDPTYSRGESNSPIGTAAAETVAGRGWMDRFLPARGFERIAFLVLLAFLMGLKTLAIYHLRVDSDETQHAHVVWGWVTGQLQYRDVFDNHMPLFQMACAPVMALIGERADIIPPLRWAMLPIFLVCVWAVYRLTDILYSRRAAPWSALCAAAYWKFFYTSTEFRTDDLWAAFWLLSLVVAVSGEFSIKRALVLGLTVGLAFAVSLKTVVLVAALGTATVVAIALAWRRGEQPSATGIAARLAAFLGGAVIPPAATVFYFVWRGAIWIMYYCVIFHNVVPGLKRWGHFSLHTWYFPASLAALGIYGRLIFQQTPGTKMAIRRTIIALTPWLFLFLLWSYWPDITREDDLPYVPLLPLSLIPLLTLTATLLRNERLRRCSWTYAMPFLVLCELVLVFKLQRLREDRLHGTTERIANVLTLTKPGDYVMDKKGDYVFRTRPYYWALETITKARIRMGLIRDNLPDRLMKTGTKLCYFYCGHSGSVASRFIVANYIPFNANTTDMGVLGKEI